MPTRQARKSVSEHAWLRQVVASSLVCLPPEDAGGAGPKVESWAFGTDREGLDVLARNRVFGVRTCKLCDDGVVVRRPTAVEVGFMSGCTSNCASKALRRRRGSNFGACLWRQA